MSVLCQAGVSLEACPSKKGLRKHKVHGTINLYKVKEEWAGGQIKPDVLSVHPDMLQRVKIVIQAESCLVAGLSITISGDFIVINLFSISLLEKTALPIK